MPLGPYPDWDACIADQKAKGKNGDEAKNICGAIEREAETRPSKLKTRDVTDVEVLDAGTWDASTGEVTLDEDELDEMVVNTNKLIALGLLAPPVKLGHPKNQKLLQQEGWPAAGWIGNLRRNGTKIVADLQKVPDKLADLIDAKSYRKISAEFWKTGFKIGDKEWSPVLTAVALLGEELPAVSTLQDFAALFKSGQPAALTLHSDDRRAAPTFVMLDRATGKTSTDDVEEDLIAAAERFAEKAAEKTKGRIGAPRLRAFLDEVRRRVRELMAEKTEAELNAAAHSFDIAGGEPEWADVDKTDLPADAYAIVGDAEDPETWALPHHFERDGTLFAHAGGIRAALAAMPTDIPDDARAHLQEHARRAEIGEEKKEADMANPAVVQALGLPEGADDAAVLAKIVELMAGQAKLSEAETKLNATEAKVAELARKDELRDATERVDGAIRARKIRPAEKEFWVAFAKDKPKEFGEYVEKQPALFTAPLGSETDAPEMAATEQLNKLANDRIAEAAKNGTKLTFRAALQQITAEQPELARQNLAERRAAAPRVASAS